MSYRPTWRAFLGEAFQELPEYAQLTADIIAEGIRKGRPVTLGGRRDGLAFRPEWHVAKMPAIDDAITR